MNTPTVQLQHQSTKHHIHGKEAMLDETENCI
jgi:hypothetical protein